MNLLSTSGVALTFVVVAYLALIIGVILATTLLLARHRSSASYSVPSRKHTAPVVMVDPPVRIRSGQFTSPLEKGFGARTIS